jgi:hypothetical protein
MGLIHPSDIAIPSLTTQLVNKHRQNAVHRSPQTTRHHTTASIPGFQPKSGRETQTKKSV